MPDRVSVGYFKTMEEELEDVVESAMQGKSTKQFHQKMKDLKCYFCDRLFWDLRGLKQHCMQSHAKAEGYLYHCGRCTHKVKSKAQMEKHIKYSHE